MIVWNCRTAIQQIQIKGFTKSLSEPFSFLAFDLDNLFGKYSVAHLEQEQHIFLQTK
jgi:hypothetical protein